eukprot:398939-Hanusia_phi.AAC.1
MQRRVPHWAAPGTRVRQRRRRVPQAAPGTSGSAGYGTPAVRQRRVPHAAPGTSGSAGYLRQRR